MVNPMDGGRFRILGPLQVRAGTGWAGVSAAKERALLAMLLLNPGRPVSSDRLIAALWDEKLPANPRNLLSVYMTHLRALIGDADASILVRQNPGYKALLAPGDLDAERFARLLTGGRQALESGEPQRAHGLLDAALGCWHGDALADVTVPEVAQEAERLSGLRAEARKLRAEAGLACGRAAEAVAEAERLTSQSPLREEFWALLMRALQRAGRQAEALEAYGRARHTLTEELGTDPGPELQQVYQQVLKGEPAAQVAAPRQGPVAPAQLPADIADFTGRAGQMDRICRLLSEPASPGSPGTVRVVLVMGSGGLGKTTLAVHAAHLVADQFPDGQLYANLHGATQPSEPAEILARFLRDLGMDGARIPVDAEERAAHFRTRLAGKRVLVVLDDARDAEQVRPLLPGSASAAVLVTARARLPELVESRVIDLDVLSVDEARTLFGRMVEERRALVEPEATREVLTACAGLPLAIRIAGARLAAREKWTVRTLADRLADEHRRLDELRVGNLAVRASFEVSFASLSRPGGPGGVDPAHVFRLLGLWTGPAISLPAVAALLGEPEPAVSDALDVLVDAHLLESPESEVYRFHDLLRVYAADRARAEEDGEDRRAAITRVLTWYLHTAEAAASVISPQHTRVPLGAVAPEVNPLMFASLDDALGWCESARAGLIPATRLAAESGLHEIAWELPAAAMSFYYRRSHWTDWLATHEIGLASARAQGDRLGEAWMLNNLGMAYGVQHMGASVSCFEEALAIYREIGNEWDTARTANNLANAYFDVGRFVEAREAADRSLAMQRQIGNRYVEGLALGTLGCAHRELGHFHEAVRCFEQALAIFRDLDDADSEADSLTDLGEAYLGWRRVEDGIGRLEESLAIRRQIGDRSSGLAVTLLHLGSARSQAGQRTQAAELLAEALRLCEELGDHVQAAAVRVALSEIPDGGRATA